MHFRSEVRPLPRCGSLQCSPGSLAGDEGARCPSPRGRSYHRVDVTVRSHCRLERPNFPPRPSSTKLDDCLVGLVRDLFPTESAGVWWSSDRVDLVLIGTKYVIPATLDPYTIISRSTRPLLDQSPITSRSLLERMATRSLLDFL